ncbi:hypothetical protein [Undibacterium flavidum]|uniref:TonB C-terminal domain-containing protein n=1 Tax=Undibacterium flavidum TaxID=2762297 RepID=A0ABR6Y7G4_9BURK|nr:hypothetical protein [Undibacterium flavidum]MBC3872535.1 hypothetical protein [Undibacterium flavidum]
MKKNIAVVSCLVLLLGLTGPSTAQVGKSSMAPAQARAGASAVEVKIMDDKGQAMRADSLPKDVQMKVDRARKAAESMLVPVGGGGAAERVTVTVSCSYPPLKCTITIAW